MTLEGSFDSRITPRLSLWRGVAAVLLALPAVQTNADAGPPSRCFGTVGHGRIDHAVSMPAAGPNFRAYSRLGSTFGRTYVHSEVRDVVVASYAALAKTMPDKTFVYGETGLARGGRFRPHRTHQNGLSVDFMVPVADASGRSAPLPGDAMNQFGYDIRFDAAGRYGDYVIDFEAMAEHLHQLQLAAAARGIGISLVIFEPTYHERLFAARRGASLRTLPWLQKAAWIRHDGHYHVDFIVPCSSLK